MEVTSEGQFSPPISPLYDDKGQLSPGSTGSGTSGGGGGGGGVGGNRLIVTSAGQVLSEPTLQVSDATILEMTNETFGQLTGGLLPIVENGGQLSPKTFGQQSTSNRSNSMAGKAKAGGKSPTCRVCGDESSGFHYGVDSCEGCKGFFRRCITQGMTHKCSNEEKCEITPFTRNSCQYCRLKKCFAVGMSREASRLGRRPKRLKDSSGEPKQPSVNLPIAPYPSPSELYKLRMAELQRLLQQNGTFKSELMQAFLSAAQVSFREHQRHGNDNQKNNKTSTSTTTESGYSSSINSPTNSTKSHSPTSDLSTPQFNNNQNQNLDSKDAIKEELPDNFRMAQEANLMPQNGVGPGGDGYDQMQIKKEPDFDVFSSSISPVLSMGSMSGGASPLILPDNMTLGQFSPSSLTPEMMNMMMSPEMAFMDNCNEEYTEPDPNANLIDIERILEEVRQVPSEIRQKLIEQMLENVGEAHTQTCHCTYEKVAEASKRHEQQKLGGGLPDMSKLSISPNTLWQTFVDNMLPEIKQVVRFCKKLPGFGEICQEDQIILIKKGSFEVLACRMLMMVDPERDEMFTPDLKMKCKRDMIKGMPMGTFLEELFLVAKMFNPIGLRENEIGLFTCILLMCSERPGLTNKKEVEKLNVLFSQTLYMSMRQYFPDHDEKFRFLMSLIPLFRRINNQHSMALNSIKMQAPEIIQALPDLHREVYDLSE